MPFNLNSQIKYLGTFLFMAYLFIRSMEGGIVIGEKEKLKSYKDLDSNELSLSIYIAWEVCLHFLEPGSLTIKER